jgi:hypothetical protein
MHQQKQERSKPKNRRRHKEKTEKIQTKNPTQQTFGGASGGTG